MQHGEEVVYLSEGVNAICVLSMFLPTHTNPNDASYLVVRVIPPVAFSPPFVPRALSSRSLIQRGVSGPIRAEDLDFLL